MGVLCAHFDKAENSLVVSIDKFLRIGILSVAGKGVLCEIVCAYAEEVYHRG